MAAEVTKRINVTFPIPLLEEPRRYVPRRKRNKFIVEATETALKRRRLLSALRDQAPAWSDEAPRFDDRGGRKPLRPPAARDMDAPLLG